MSFMGSITAIIPDHVSVPREMLAAAVESVRSQTVPIEQIVVMHDTDGRGPAWARNEAARCASGAWLLLLDADDTIDPVFVAECERAIVARRDRTSVVIPAAGPLSDEIYFNNYLPYCCLIRHAVWDEMGGHQEPSPRGQGICDWDLWIRLHQAGRDGEIAYIPDGLFWHRDREGSMSKWDMGRFEQMCADLKRVRNLPDRHELEAGP